MVLKPILPLKCAFHFQQPRNDFTAKIPKPADITNRRVDFSNDGSSQTRRFVKTRQRFRRPRALQCAPHKPFFLSLSPPDISKSRVDFSNDGSSPTRRVVTTRKHIQHPYGLHCAPHPRFFLSPSQPDISKSRVDFPSDGAKTESLHGCHCFPSTASQHSDWWSDRSYCYDTNMSSRNPNKGFVLEAFRKFLIKENII